MKKMLTLCTLLALTLVACDKKDEKKVEKALEKAGEKVEDAGKAAEKTLASAGAELVGKLEKVVAKLKEKAAAAKGGNLTAATELKEAKAQVQDALQALDAVQDQLTPEQKTQVAELKKSAADLLK